jgi:hypothetical protein
MAFSQAQAFVEAGWAPSGVISASGVHDGVAYMGAERVLMHLEEAGGF